MCRHKISRSRSTDFITVYLPKAQIQQGEGNDPMEREDEDSQQCGFRGTSLVQPNQSK